MAPRTMMTHAVWISTWLASTSAMADGSPGIGPAGPIEKIATGFQFTEGPAADADGNLYFTDIPNNRIHKLATDGTLNVFVEPSGHCNGLMVVGNRLLACAMDGRLTSFSLDDGAETVLAAEYNGARFNAPNDLVIDKSGGIYFTDPRFRAPDPWPQGTEAVYYRSSDGTVTRVVENEFAPNGVILSPDEATLYVIPSGEHRMWAYPVESQGRPGEGRVFCELKQRKAGERSGGDGLTIDTDGNLYITSGMGVQVFDPSGKLLVIIEIPEKPANVTFGGPDRKTLYATARTSLYAVSMDAKGHVFLGAE